MTATSGPGLSLMSEVVGLASMTELWPERKSLQKFFWMTDADGKRFAAPEPAQLGKQ